VGELEFPRNVSRCSEGRSFEEVTNKTTLTVARADVWWYCGGPLLEVLLVKWSGTCTLVQLAIPFTLAFQNPKPSLTKRKQKQDLTSPGGSFNSHMYVDDIRSHEGFIS
jgi:hypothetical protein